MEDAVAAARALGMPLDVCGKIQDTQLLGVSNTRQWRGDHLSRLLGPADLARRFGEARVTLATPHWIEAFGNTVIESMACGTPVVAYDAGGPAETMDTARTEYWWRERRVWRG